MLRCVNPDTPYACGHEVRYRWQSGAGSMATGWAGDGAVQQQIDDSVAEAIERARARLPSGPGLSHCGECGEPIPEARRQAMQRRTPGTACQSEADQHVQATSAYNRRGSKDSQLR
jgi:RNA polymerase-binding transcription factor DksA